MTKFLTLKDAVRVTKRLGFYVKDAGLLEGALARPQTSLFGQEAYPEFELKVAAMMHSIIKNHPMIDGNKRTAWSLSVIFMFMNGLKHNFTEDEAYDLVLGVAMDKYDIAEAAKIIRMHLVKR
ncbi:MAG: type II toxin-antitoxin system death-on-curing family toxin [Micrococcales bacterium]